MKKDKNNNNRKHRKEDDGFADDDNLIDKSDDKYTTDEDEFLDEVNKLTQGKKKSKLKSVFELIGKPKQYNLLKLNSGIDKDLYVGLLSLLEKYNVMVHFKLDYDFEEKYRFIVEEVFLQGVDEDNKKSVKAFVYEDFHPEIISPLDEDEEF
ncbi:MAG: hypothetical protein WCK13_05085 [Ignavibacteriota bacterium]|nr:hypothetical protein [Ignavibacteriota bacterium]